jgi:hypothetical protein
MIHVGTLPAAREEEPAKDGRRGNSVWDTTNDCKGEKGISMPTHTHTHTHTHTQHTRKNSHTNPHTHTNMYAHNNTHAHTYTQTDTHIGNTPWRSDRGGGVLAQSLRTYAIHLHRCPWSHAQVLRATGKSTQFNRREVRLRRPQERERERERERAITNESPCNQRTRLNL